MPPAGAGGLVRPFWCISANLGWTCCNWRGLWIAQAAAAQLAGEPSCAAFLAFCRCALQISLLLSERCVRMGSRGEKETPLGLGSDVLRGAVQPDQCPPQAQQEQLWAAACASHSPEWEGGADQARHLPDCFQERRSLQRDGRVPRLPQCGNPSHILFPTQPCAGPQASF